VGDIKLKAWLALEITALVQFLNLGKNMSDTQIAGTIDFILQDYSNLNMADFKLFFNGIKQGKCGTLYDRIDGQVILSLLSEYKSERAHSAETMQIVQQSQYKQDERLETKEDYSAGYLDAIKEILKEVEEKKKAFKEEPKKQPIKQDQFRALHNRWMKQFNNLHRGTKFRRYGIESALPFIQVGRLKPMSLNEFLLYKSR
jgi:hypothetical protein